MFGLGPATKVYLALGATDMRKGDWVSVQLTDEQRELIAGVLREFMSGLTQKILGSAPAGAASNLDFSRIPR